MLPNRKMEQNESHSEETIIPSSEPHIVVGCPSCKTKFAVEGSLVASFETPRFHCSRCDSVFELSNSRKAPAIPTNTEYQQPRWILADGARPNDLIHEKSSASVAPMLQSTDFSLGAPQVEHDRPSPSVALPVEERSGLSLLGMNLSATWLSPASLTREATKTAARAGKAPVSISEDPFSLFDDPTTPEATTPAVSALPKQPAVPVAPPPVSPPSAPQPTTTSPRDLQPQREIPPTPQPQIAETSSPTPARVAARGSMLARGLERLSWRNYSLAVLSAPVLITMATLGTVGYAARLAPETVDATLHAIVPSVLTGQIVKVPPAELSARQLSLKFEKTQSREVLGVVRGVIFNGTQESLDDVQIEALGFNDRGELVTRTQAPLRSALARERIADLPLATVRKFQESLSARSANIAPGEQVPFTIALLEDTSTAGLVDLSQVKYFSARVFSIANK